jgi:hypothetical protein
MVVVQIIEVNLTNLTLEEFVASSSIKDKYGNGSNSSSRGMARNKEIVPGIGFRLE